MYSNNRLWSLFHSKVFLASVQQGTACQGHSEIWAARNSIFAQAPVTLNVLRTSLEESGEARSALRKGHWILVMKITSPHGTVEVIPSAQICPCRTPDADTKQVFKCVGLEFFSCFLSLPFSLISKYYISIYFHVCTCVCVQIYAFRFGDWSHKSL